MRYSDDFMVVIPRIELKMASIINPIFSILKEVPNLDLQPQKTQIFSVNREVIENVGKNFLPDADCSNKYINFLGFTFDGNNVSIRSKTVSKYYYRMYRKARAISRNKDYAGSDKLYKRYSINGAKARPGNFFTYVSHAEDVFGEDELIYRDLKRHMQKIRKALKNG